MDDAANSTQTVMSAFTELVHLAPQSRRLSLALKGLHKITGELIAETRRQ
jgi:hypothetical protein